MNHHRKQELNTPWRSARYETADVNDKLVINLRDLGHTLRSLYEGKGSQKRILIILEEIGGSITQQQLTRRLGIQPGSASEVIAKLESAGCVRRTPSETDRRTTDIILTESGKELAASARMQRARRHQQMFACLSDDEKQQLLSLLERINGDWEERYQELAADSKPRGHHRRATHPEEHFHGEVRRGGQLLGEQPHEDRPHEGQPRREQPHGDRSHEGHPHEKQQHRQAYGQEGE